MINAYSRYDSAKTQSEKPSKKFLFLLAPTSSDAFNQLSQWFGDGGKNSHPSIMSLICRLKQSDYAFEVQLRMMNRFSRTLNKHLNGYFSLSVRGTFFFIIELNSWRDNY